MVSGRKGHKSHVSVTDILIESMKNYSANTSKQQKTITKLEKNLEEAKDELKASQVNYSLTIEQYVFYYVQHIDT
jgi:molybdenum-dependent DNA-binding transcriptional regulator ModE